MPRSFQWQSLCLSRRYFDEQVFPFSKNFPSSGIHYTVDQILLPNLLSASSVISNNSMTMIDQLANAHSCVPSNTTLQQQPKPILQVTESGDTVPCHAVVNTNVAVVVPIAVAENAFVADSSGIVFASNQVVP